MRQDIGKVITERERRKGGKYSARREGYQKQLERAMGPSPVGRSYADMELGNADRFDGLVKRESILERGGNTKDFTDVLGALSGWVRKQVGRRGDSALAEVAAVLPASGGVSLSHARDHLWQFLITNVVRIDGKLCDASHGGGPFPLQYTRAIAYIDPDDGIIKAVPGYRRYRGPKRQGFLTKRDGRNFAQLKGIWYELEIRPAASRLETVKRHWYGRETNVLYSRVPKYDLAIDCLTRQVISWENRRDREQRYGFDAYCASARQLNSREIKRLGLNGPVSQKPNLWRKRKPKR